MVSFLEYFFETRKVDVELSAQISSYDQRAMTEGRQIVDVAIGTTKGFLYPEEMTARIEEKTIGMISESLIIFHRDKDCLRKL